MFKIIVLIYFVDMAWLSKYFKTFETIYFILILIKDFFLFIFFFLNYSDAFFYEHVILIFEWYLFNVKIVYSDILYGRG